MRAAVYALLVIYLFCLGPVAIAQDREPDPGLDAQPVQPLEAQGQPDQPALPALTWSEWLNGVIPFLLVVCAWAIRRGGKLAEVAAVLVRVIHDPNRPSTLVEAHAEAKAAGVAPVLEKVVRKETGKLSPAEPAPGGAS